MQSSIPIGGITTEPVNKYNPVNLTGNTVQTSSSNPVSSSGAIGGAKGADRDTFLKLLVAQLKNQDPLSPQDGTQFVAQLAQFSALDQLISINQQISAITNK